MGIARTRHCLSTQKDRTIECQHCATCFQTERGAVQHEKNCAHRRELAGLPLSTQRWHKTADDAAKL
eukprot:7015529-Pyramimonas_sp.AAC.1